MNLEIAAKLVELRKSHGYSQEELADKLGVSRQAVSKWERVEASPDTDNLIALAKLYGISLDELLNIKLSESSEKPEGGEDKDGEDDVKDKNAEPEGGIHIESEGSTVHIGLNGIHVKDGDNGDEVHIGLSGIHVTEHEKARRAAHDHRYNYVYNYKKPASRVQEFSPVADGASALLCLTAYLLLGFLLDAWHPGWLVFLAIPVLPVLLYPKRIEGCFPIIVTGCYLMMGFLWKLWHPGWVIFLAIPIFYTFWGFFKDRIKKRKENA